jgi:hypothetical protein
MLGQPCEFQVHGPHAPRAASSARTPSALPRRGHQQLLINMITRIKSSAQCMATLCLCGSGRVGRASGEEGGQQDADEAGQAELGLA